MNFHDFRARWMTRAIHISIAAASAAAVLTSGVAMMTAIPAHAAIARDVSQALKLRLPKTPIDALDCRSFAPWCEVVSGDTLFYIDEAARYLFVGRLYDLEERRDVTATRLIELNPDLLAAGAARAAGRAESAAPNRSAKTAKAKVDTSSLPKEGAIHWGNPKGEKLIVFSDFQCGYCRQLTQALEGTGLAIEERPISIFGASSRRMAQSVLCAQDPVKAMHAAYAGETSPVPSTCNVSDALDANEAFAKANGFSGTPVIVRARDGAVIHGYRDAQTLIRFANGGADQ
ncbi:DsbC family protein [Erythrobacter sp. SCSIO 43205]|uniref:DsbC family protein n=1 Tax=Erythrobacter sp. SCSIO 43205 TaxID=2779361 RepID=UPI001CA9AD5A|nr:DsbC family protein [Erythrobacter sp. SCSIO 43205]UAB78944.1 DsbC family protein [Erythrobacter sp. SCSIO 43205]